MVRKIKICMVFFIFISPYLYGDGGMFIPPDPEAYMEEDYQIGFIRWNGSREELVLVPHFRGNVKEFLWVVPFPSYPEVDTFSLDVIKELNEATYVEYDYGYGCMGGVEGKGYGDEVGNTILESYEKGIYRFEVWRVTDAEDFVKKIDSLKFSSANADTVIQYYIDKDWNYFVVVRLKDLEVDSGIIQPIKFTFSHGRCVYPLFISSISNADDMGCLIIVASTVPLKPEFYLDETFATKLTDNRIKKLKRDYPLASAQVEDMKYLMRFETEYLGVYQDIEFKEDEDFQEIGMRLDFSPLLIFTGVIFKLRKKKKEFS